MIPFGTTLPQHDPSRPAITLTPFDATTATEMAEAFAEMSPWNRIPFTPDTMARYFEAQEAGAPRYVLRCADASNTAVGALGLRENWLRGPYIQFLGLTKSFQGRGVGANVLREIEARARKEDAQNVWVMASDFNNRALAFYRRFGFSPVANIDALLSAEQTEVLLRKRLW